MVEVHYDVSLEKVVREIQEEEYASYHVMRLIKTAQNNNKKRKKACDIIEDLIKSDSTRKDVADNFKNLIHLLIETDNIELQEQIINICLEIYTVTSDRAINMCSSSIIEAYSDLKNRQKVLISRIIECVARVNPSVVADNKEIIDELFAISKKGKIRAVGMLNQLVINDHSRIVLNFEKELFDLVKEPEKIDSALLVLVGVARKHPKEASINKIKKTLLKYILGKNSYNIKDRNYGLVLSARFVIDIPEHSDEVLSTIGICFSNENLVRQASITCYNIGLEKPDVFSEFSEISCKKVSNAMRSVNVNKDVYENYEDVVQSIENEDV